MKWRKTRKVMPPRAVATDPPAFLKAVLQDLKNLDMELPSKDENVLWVCNMALRVLNTTLDNIYELERHQYDVCKSGAVSDEARNMIVDMMWQQEYMRRDIHELQQVMYLIAEQVKVSEKTMRLLELEAKTGELISDRRTFRPGDDQPVDYMYRLFKEYGYRPGM